MPGADDDPLGFMDSVEEAFAFLKDFGYEIVRRTPTIMRYEANDRYIAVVHDAGRSFGLGVRFGALHDNESGVTLKEIVNGIAGYGAYRDRAGSNRTGVEAAVSQLAVDVRRYPDVLRGRLPNGAIDSYRRRLTDYYSGRSDTSPDRGRLP